MLWVWTKQGSSLQGQKMKDKARLWLEFKVGQRPFLSGGSGKTQRADNNSYQVLSPHPCWALFKKAHRVVSFNSHNNSMVTTDNVPQLQTRKLKLKESQRLFQVRNSVGTWTQVSVLTTRSHGVKSSTWAACLTRPGQTQPDPASWHQVVVGGEKGGMGFVWV